MGIGDGEQQGMTREEILAAREPCPSCELRKAEVPGPTGGPHLCKICADEGRKYGWD